MFASNHLIGFGAAVDSIVESLVTWNPSDKGSNVTLSNGNLDATAGAGFTNSTVRATIGKTSGKYYWEVLVVAQSASGMVLGASDAQAGVLATYVGAAANGRGHQSAGANDYVVGWTAGSAGTTFTTNDVLMFAVDVGAGKLFYGVNGTWASSSDPVAGTLPWATNLTGTIYAAATCSTSNTARLRTTLASFTQAVPSGYLSYASP